MIMNLVKDILGIPVDPNKRKSQNQSRTSKGKKRTQSIQSRAPFDYVHQFMRLKDGDMRLFARISPVNPDNLNSNEFEANVEMFQEIFNSNPGKIQMKASSEPIRIDHHLALISERKDAADSGYKLTRINAYEKYALEKKRYSKSQKVYYITIRSSISDDEEAEKELRSTIENMQEKLNEHDMQVTILTDKQTRRLLYQKLNPGTSVSQDFEKELTDDDLLPPYMKDWTTYLEVDEVYFRQYFIKKYPSGKNRPGWFNQILNKDNVDLDIFAVPMESDELGGSISNSIKHLEDKKADTKSREEKIKMEKQILSQEELLQEIQDNQAFNVGVVITVYSRSIDEMMKQSRLVEKALKSNGMIPMLLGERGFQPFFYYLPICFVDDLLSRFSQPMHSLCLASIFPFQASEITSNRGVITGYNPTNDSLIIVDRFDRMKYNNGNGVTLGGSGAGKTAAKTSEIDRLITLDEIDRAVIIDPEAEYHLPNATRAVFEIGGKYCTNPFHIRSIVLDSENNSKDGMLHAGKKMLQQTADITSWLRWVHPEMKREEASQASRIIRLSFAKHGMTENSEEIPLNYEEPTLLTFEEMAKKENVLTDLREILNPYIHGEYKSLFCGPTNWNMNDKLTVLDLNNLEQGMQSPLYDLLLKDIWAEFKKDRNERTALYCDEGHRMLDKNNIMTLIFLVHAFKQFRKYSSYIELMTQQFGDIIAMGIQYAQQILANASIKTYLYMDTEWESLLTVQKLSQKEIDTIRKKSQKGRGVIIAGETRTMFQSEPTLDQWQFIDPKKYEALIKGMEQVG
ncbi:AAA-like domain protein [compost metagenome]